MNYSTNNSTSKRTFTNAQKPWAPKPMRTNNPSNRKSNGKKGFMQSMAQNAPGSDMPYRVVNLKRTENGALEYATTGMALLDINSQLSSLRSKSENEIIQMFRKAFIENPVLAMRWLFFAADIRYGNGERRAFQVIIKDLIRNGGSQMVANLVPLIPEYIRWDMLYTLLEVTDGRVFAAVSNLIRSQWSQDIAQVEINRLDPSNKCPISLLGKWLKSCNSHNPDTRSKGIITANILGLTEKQYRKSLTALRNYLEVVETRMSSNNWQAIDYEKVPSKANLIYNNAFLRNDEERRRAYLGALKTGHAKINSRVTFPYEIIHKLNRTSYGENQKSLIAMWEALPDLIGDDAGDTLVVADDSGSMERRIENTEATAMEVCFSLAIYFAERNKGTYHNQVMTFSRTPRLRVFHKNWNVKQKLDFMYKHSEVSNTDIEKVFDLILNTAIENNSPQSDLPARILLLSDGEFDAMSCKVGRNYNRAYCDQTLFKAIEQKFKDHGYTMPKLVFWNLNGRSGAMPFNMNEKFPCTLISGFSVNVFKMVLSDKANPWDALVEQLLNKRYDAVEDAAFSKANSQRTNTPRGDTHVKGRIHNESSSYRKPPKKGPNQTKSKHVASGYRRTAKNRFNNTH